MGYVGRNCGQQPRRSARPGPTESPGRRHSRLATAGYGRTDARRRNSQTSIRPLFASPAALLGALARRLPLRILLADDNPINQKVGLSVLHKLGYRADVANNGLDVLKALEQKAYDILFLDVQMPEMDGLEAARHICERWSPEKRPRIIAMTGNALMGDREKCLESGMDDYISKPVRIGDLQAALERWGPGRGQKSDTTFITRPQELSPEQVLDQSIIAELREMPPTDGVSMLSEL